MQNGHKQIADHYAEVASLYGEAEVKRMMESAADNDENPEIVVEQMWKTAQQNNPGCDKH